MDQTISKLSGEISETRNHILGMEAIIDVNQHDDEAKRSWKAAHTHIRVLERELDEYIEG